METVPAPARIYKRAPNGNTYLAYAEGDPVPVEEARELGIAGAKAKPRAEVSDKAVPADQVSDKAVAVRPARTRKGKE